MTWQLGSALVLSVALAVGFAWYERSRPPARVLALVAALAALAAIGRVAFAAFPNVKPTTDIVLFSGFALGGPAGFAVGALAALVSNIFLGQGPWTPWQMVAWGIVGLLGAALGSLLRRHQPGRLVLALVCGFAGLLFGAIMDLYQWSLGAEHTLASYLAVSGTSLGFNIAHAVGNVVFALILGPAFVRALRRYRRRFEVTWRAPVPAAAAALAALALVAGVAQPNAAQATPPPDVAPAIARAVRYLEGAQNRDGGYGSAAREASDMYFAGWAALGLASAERNPQDVVRRGNSIVDYMRRNVRALQASQDYERALLALRAAGVHPRSFGGRDLVTRLRRKQRRDGSFDGLTDRTAFGILAYRAAGFGRRSAPVRSAARWLLRRNNDDGGYGNAPGARSDIDNTAAVLQALGAAGRRGPVARAAARYLRNSQNRDGGFSLNRGGQSNSQSTAYAILGLRAVGINPRELRRRGGTPISFLKRMQASDGSFRYNRDSAQTPVWVTAQALLGLEAKPLPLRPVPRRKATTARASTSAATGGRAVAADRDAASGGGAAGKAEHVPQKRADAPDDAPAAREDSPARDADAAVSEADGDATQVAASPTAADTATTPEPASGQAADEGPSAFELSAFAAVLVVLTLVALRFAWRRG